METSTNSTSSRKRRSRTGCPGCLVCSMSSSRGSPMDSPAISRSTSRSTHRLRSALTPARFRPERETELEGGLDASGLDQRASLALTFYQKSIRDLILNVVPAPSLGYNVSIQNGGSIRNRGVEVALGLTPVQRGEVSWVSHTTFARNVGIVTGLPPGIPFFNIERDATGQRVAFGSGYGIGRLEVGKRVTQIVATDSVGGTVQEVQKGDGAPAFTMGFGNDITFGRLRLTSLFDWSHGGDLVNITMDVYDAFGLSPNQADGGLSVRAGCLLREAARGDAVLRLAGRYGKALPGRSAWSAPRAQRPKPQDLVQLSRCGS
ncbi:MAG: hypothetical protein DMD63_05305 [Gemmatimonadetes bacterium]|nr:MAG: hypothetical protein DMD63_05305 [Gemmatimonadota bacterium]